MRRIGYSIMLTLGMTLLFGCSTAPATKIDYNSATPALIHERVRANIEQIQTLSGTGTIAMESPDMAGSGSFEIALRKPDSLLLRLEGPFGIEVGLALVTRHEFMFYNSLQNQLITGSTNSTNLSKTLRMNITFDDLMSVFTGASFFASDGDTPDEFEVKDEQYVLTYRHLEATRIYWVDPATLLVSKVQHLDANGKLVAEQRYAKYSTVKEGSFPASVRFIMNAQRRAVSVFYETVKLNDPALSFATDIPLNARRTRIE